jgi:glycerophosphoryl diester phosphodiesterase
MSDSAITLPTNTITDDAISLEPASRYDTQKARIVAHRGGVTNGENSLITTLQAADMGIHHIELDVALTSDNKILLTNGDLNNLQCQ